MYPSIYLASYVSMSTYVWPFFDICPSENGCKGASRHSLMPFFHAPTSKSGRDPSFVTFWLENALGATAPWNFSLISPLATWLRTRRFSQPTFRPSRPTWKNTAIRDFPNILQDCIFFLLTLAHLYLPSSDSTSALLFISPYCRKFDF